MRDAARETAPSEPAVAQKLRDALTEMDESDLGNHVQRTADWLRRGVNPNSNGTENEIAQGLSKLSQQLQQAQGAMRQAKPAPGDQGGADQTAALNQLERLRGQLEGFGRGRDGDNGQQRQGGQAAQSRKGQPGNSGLRSDGRQSGANSHAGQPGNWTAGGQSLSRSEQRGGGGAQPEGDPANRNNGGFSGDTRNGGGGANGTVWGNFDTGNNTPRSRGQHEAAPNDASGNPADTERFLDQRMRDLDQLRQMVRDDPQAAKDVADLTRQMQHLDPSRFPGNPAMVEHMHQEILENIDKLELQLQHDGASSQARTGKPDSIPAGYQDSVAEYYRRLSKN